jgi:hypothetical protein
MEELLEAVDTVDLCYVIWKRLRIKDRVFVVSFSAEEGGA